MPPPSLVCPTGREICCAQIRSAVVSGLPFSRSLDDFDRFNSFVCTEQLMVTSRPLGIVMLTASPATTMRQADSVCSTTPIRTHRNLGGAARLCFLRLHRRKTA